MPVAEVAIPGFEGGDHEYLDAGLMPSTWQGPSWMTGWLD